MATTPGLLQPDAPGVARLEPGAAADLCVVERTGAHHVGVEHPVPGLALRARPSDVRAVVVDGRLVVDDHALVVVDLAELQDQAQRALDVVRAHSGAPAGASR